MSRAVDSAFKSIEEQPIARSDSLYRVAASDDPDGDFLRDGATGELRVSVEQFAPAVGGSYSCTLVSVHCRHKNDPWSVLGRIMPGPNNPPRDSIIRFEAKVLDFNPELEGLMKIAHLNSVAYKAGEEASVKQTQSCSHVSVGRLDGDKMTEEDKHRFVESINLWGWTKILPGQY